MNTIICKNKNDDPKTCIKTGNELITDPYITGNKLNIFFTTITSKLVSKIKTNSNFRNFQTKVILNQFS